MWENELTALGDDAKIYSLRNNYIALKTYQDQEVAHEIQLEHLR